MFNPHKQAGAPFSHVVILGGTNDLGSLGRGGPSQRQARACVFSSPVLWARAVKLPLVKSESQVFHHLPAQRASC